MPATTSLRSERVEALEPWDLEGVRAYNPAFLSGFKAQRYQINLEQGFERAKDLMAPVIERDVRNDIGGDEQRIEDMTTEYFGNDVQTPAAAGLRGRVPVQRQSFSDRG